MCNADSSSYINQERFNAGIQPKLLDNINNFQIALDAIDALPDLISVSFIGGEFFAEKENQLILDKLIERNIGATIVTNGSIINFNLLNKLKQVNNLEMRVSIDGTGDTYEFIRYPAKWETLIANLKILKENLPQVTLECNTVIQPLNLQNLHELYHWANQNRLIAHHQILIGPPYLGWGILNATERQQLKELMQKKQSAEFKLTTKQSQTISDISNSLDQTTYSVELREKGVDFISKLCKYRKLSSDTIQKQFGILDNLANEILLNVNRL
jgi:sulfatase maturation enzyme AslB (radical SAM superfamily)